MDVQTLLETLRLEAPSLRLVATMLPAWLPELNDAELAAVDVELARLAPRLRTRRMRGFLDALSCIVSGAIQERAARREAALPAGALPRCP